MFTLSNEEKIQLGEIIEYLHLNKRIKKIKTILFGLVISLKFDCKKIVVIVVNQAVKETKNKIIEYLSGHFITKYIPVLIIGGLLIL